MATAMTFAAGLQSLASSTTAAQASAEVDLSADTTHKDVIVQATIVGAATGTLTDKLVDVFCLTSLDGTNYDGDTAYSGTAAAYTLTAAGSPNMRRLGSLSINANTGVTCRGTWSLLDRLGFRPIWFAIV